MLASNNGALVASGMGTAWVAAVSRLISVQSQQMMTEGISAIDASLSINRLAFSPTAVLSETLTSGHC